MADFYEVGIFIVLYSGFVISALWVTVTEPTLKTQRVVEYKKPRGRKDSNLEVA